MQEDLALDIYYKKIKELENLWTKDYKDFNRYDYEYFKDVLSVEDFKKALRLKNRKKAKRKRCYKLMLPIINEYIERFVNKGEYCVLVFGTCTFNNKQMTYKEETRTKSVNKWIKKHFSWSVVNIDYGDKNEREHHHFIGITNELLEPTNKRGKKGYQLYELKNKDYKLGFEPDLEIIDDIFNDRKISNYLVKYNFHSNKKSTKNRRIRLIKK